MVAISTYTESDGTNIIQVGFKAPKADNAPKKANTQVLGTIWQEKGLNKNLIAKIRPVKEGNLEGGQGNETYLPMANEPTVAMLFEDAEFAIESQYSTPFESSNPEGRMPNLMGMIQSGQMASAGYSFFNGGKEKEEGASDGYLDKALQELQGLKGRSNFTKLNSRQIFTSTSSVRITATIVFHAWSNANAEVEQALSKLQQWALPVALSKQSLLVQLSSEGFSEALFPSIIPPLVMLQYGGKTYNPLVIESISAPITAPMTKNGDRIAVKAQITLLSLMAWDMQDVVNLNR